ncbi:MAG: hypothetical protein KGI72_05350 [Patescibacteria group bacterium]|nr:hypothetical protein [Patescibacteria group bacterium]MDE2233086.1 hypothetical protein [Patescibacteria group bacterium]
MEKEICAYAAGLFDGEGYVDIYNAPLSKASKSPSLMLRVVISQKDGVIMNWLKSQFGGNVALQRKGKYYIYRWSIKSQIAYRFLISISPFVKIKKSQVELAIEFEKTKGRYLDTLKGHQGFRTLSKQEITQRMRMKEQLKRLNKQYAPYIKNGAATTTE